MTRKPSLTLTLTTEEARALLYAAGTCLLAKDALAARRIGWERKALRSAQKKLCRAQQEVLSRLESCRAT